MSKTDPLEKRVEELEKELRSARAQTKTYLQNVAHQLTAPLGAIKWSIEALKDQTIPYTRKGKLLSSVYSQATILVHLIKNFALMSNLDADDEQLGQLRNQENVDLMRLSINLANDFQPQAFDMEKKIVVDDDSFKKLRNATVLAEKNLLAQAISNLLENAVKYSESGTTIEVRAETIEGVGLSVSSIGIPITEADRGKLFERGFRGSQARQKIAPGTGIGLYLASRVMQLHQGKISLHTAGKQTKFTLIFPVERMK